MGKPNEFNLYQSIAGTLVEDAPDSGASYYLLMRLGIVNPGKVVPYLVNELGNSMWGGHEDETRAYAERAGIVLQKMGKSAVPALCSILRNGNTEEWRREKILVIIGAIESGSAMRRMAIKGMTGRFLFQKKASLPRQPLKI